MEHKKHLPLSFPLSRLLPLPLSLSLLSLFSLLLQIRFSSATELSAYEQLAAHGLPPNLLPETVVSYTLSPSGEFSVILKGECYSSVRNGAIPVYYAPRLTGFLGSAKLSYLRGVSVRPPQYGFFWLRVVTIYVDQRPPAGTIHIGVGLGLQEALPLEDFSPEHPKCADEKPEFGPMNFKRPFIVNEASKVMRKALGMNSTQVRAIKR